MLITLMIGYVLIRLVIMQFLPFMKYDAVYIKSQPAWPDAEIGASGQYFLKFFPPPRCKVERRMGLPGASREASFFQVN